MPAAILGPVAGAVVGGMMSDGGGQQTATKDPWGPAQKPLINSLTTGTALENYYQRNPFNPLQQAGYQNLYADLDNFRNVMAPQAMAFNNRMMNTNYQRKPAGTELGGAFAPINASQFLPPEQRQPQGGMGGGLAGVMNGLGGMQGLGSMGSAASMLAGQGGSEMGYMKPEQIGGGLASGMGEIGGMPALGLMGSAASMMGGQSGADIGNMLPMRVPNAGLLGGQPFGMSVVAPNSQSYGLLNWQELNPFTATNGIPKKPPVDPNAKTPEQIAMEEAAQRERDRLTNYGGA